MLVKECMTKNVKVGSPNMTLSEAAIKMRDGDFGFLPIGENDKLVGMLTDRDIAVRGVAAGMDIKQNKIRDIMSKKVLYCFEDQSLDEVVESFMQNKVRRLPVLNRNKRLVGILSLGDLAHSDVQPDKIDKVLYEVTSP